MTTNKIRFFGSDDFSKVVFDALKKAGFDVSNEGTGDLGVVASYGKIISKKVINSFKYGVLNVHPSLLPKYRGPSPIQYAILNGDTETGVTIMKMDEKVDHGPTVSQIKHQISKIKSYSELRDDLAQIGAELLIKTIPDYISGKITPRPQDESQATYTKMISREDGKVDLEKDPPELIYRKFLAFENWPGIFTYQKSKIKNQNFRLKIIDCKLSDGKLEIIKLQPEGKKIMRINEFENGYGKLNNAPYPPLINKRG